MCGDRFQTDMSAVPGFFYQFLSSNPALAGVEIRLGVNEFPNNVDHYGFITVANGETQAQEKQEAAWNSEIDQIWKQSQAVNGGGLANTIEQALEAFTKESATNKHLVIFSDGMLSLEGPSTWKTLTDREDSDSDNNEIIDTNDPQWLEHRLSQAHVHLHYVYYECLPKSEDEIGFRADYEDWEALVNGLQKDNSTGVFDEDKWIKIHGWPTGDGTWDERVAALRTHLGQDEEDDDLPMPGLLDVLLKFVLQPLLPQEWVPGQGLLEARQIFLPAGTKVEDAVINLPGAIEGVTVYSLGLDDGMVLSVDDSNYPVDNETDELIDRFREGIAADGTCSGHTFNFEHEDKGNYILESPMLVWWQLDPIATGTIQVGFDNLTRDNAMLVAESQLSAAGVVGWDPAAENLPALQHCFRLEVIPSGTNASGDNSHVRDLSPNEPFDHPFQPQDGNFELALDVAVWRRKTVVSASAESIPVSSEWELIAQIPLEPIHFAYQPTLREDSNLQPISCSDKTRPCAITIPLDFATEGYYPRGRWPGDPEVYVLARKAFNSGVAPSCQSKSNHSSPDNQGQLPIPDGWYYLALEPNNKGESRHLLVGENGNEQASLKLPSENAGSILILLEEEEREECGIDYLYVRWLAGSIPPIFCSFNNGTCAQTQEFPELAAAISTN